MSKAVFPVGDRVLVRLHKQENVSAGGIVLATPKQRRLEQQAECKAEVVRIGPLAWEDMAGGPWAHVGDTVIISKYSGVVAPEGDDEEEYRLIAAVDVLAVVTEVH